MKSKHPEKQLTKGLANKNPNTLIVFSSKFLGDHSRFFSLVQRMIGSQSAIKNQNNLLWVKGKRKKDEEIFIWIRLICPKAGFLFNQQGFSSTTPHGFLFKSDSSQNVFFLNLFFITGDHKGVKVQSGSNKK